MKLLKGLKQSEETSTLNFLLRDVGRNFSDLRDAHVRQLLLLELKNQTRNAPFQPILEQFEQLNQSSIKATEYSMLTEKNEFMALKEVLENNDSIDQYFSLKNPNHLKISEIFGLSYLKSFNAFNCSMEGLDPTLLHEWRKRLKDVQYHFELLYDNLNIGIQKHYLKTQDLCTLLGELNDLDMLNHWMTNQQHKLTNDGNLHSKLSEEVTKQHEDLLSVAKTNGLILYTFTPDQFEEQLF